MKKVEQALADLKQGKMIILVDDEDRENEGDLVIAAEYINSEKMNFIIRNSSGIVCLCLTEAKTRELNLPMMIAPENNTSRFRTGFTVSIEAAEGVTTGVSAQDRVQTIRAAIQPNAKPSDLARPGHVFPLSANEGGVLIREGHTEGSVDLMKLAGLTPAAVLCEVMNSDGTMSRLPELEIFAQQHDLLILSIQDIKNYRLAHEDLVEKISEAILPIQELGEFKIMIFRDRIHQEEYIVLQRGEINPTNFNYVRLHSQCLTGDVFGSVRCDCHSQLQASLQKIAATGGVLLYLSQEGRGIGLANKIKAYALQEQGFDTVEANRHLGFADDLRDYTMSTQILRTLGIDKVRLLTNNPRKLAALEAAGFLVQREPLQMAASIHNQQYLRAKRDKLGHLLNQEDES